ncbi:hypothetical protein F4678DRAFT_444505 [Xylaria arbuscula]|nr:hypothetical protein F4678DRAFT_444505 [Xylaria arbuscula]
MDMQIETLLEAVQECPDIYELAAQQDTNPRAYFWGALPRNYNFFDRPREEVTLVVIPADSERLEEAFREAIRHAYPFVSSLFGLNGSGEKPVTIAVPNAYSTNQCDIMESFIAQLSPLFQMEDLYLNWRNKLEAMQDCAQSDIRRPLNYAPLVYIIDIDAAFPLVEAQYLIEILKREVVWKNGGRLVFYSCRDISRQLELRPTVPYENTYEDSLFG